MEKEKFIKFSIITFVIGLVMLLLTYFCFHYVTDEGITLIWHAEADKPVVTYLLGFCGVLFIWSSITSLLVYSIFVKKDNS